MSGDEYERATLSETRNVTVSAAQYNVGWMGQTFPNSKPAERCAELELVRRKDSICLLEYFVWCD